MKWLVIAVVGIGTYAFRAIPLSAPVHRFPVWLKRGLGYITPAVLGALVGPSLLLHGGRLLAPWHHPAFLAAIPTALSGWFGRNLLLTVAVGVVSFGLIRSVLGRSINLP